MLQFDKFCIVAINYCVQCFFLFSYPGYPGSMFLVNITFEDGVEESEEVGPLGPHMGYRWVRADPRITPGWADPGNSGSGTGKSGKTGKSVSRPFCFITAELGHLQTW